MTDSIRELYDEVSATDDPRALFNERDGLCIPQSVLSLAPFNGPRRVLLR
jgi:hypothetical protein